MISGTESKVIDTNTKEIWLQEIIRETDHFYQGELQNEQRVSWLLATAGVMIAILASLGSTVMIRKGWFIESTVIVALISFAVCAIISLQTLLPLKGIRAWRDSFGRMYRDERRKGIDELIEDRFRHGESWSIQNYEQRIQYHYRSHYLRFLRKAYGVLWATRLLLVGLIFLAAAAISFISPFDISKLISSLLR